MTQDLMTGLNVTLHELSLKPNGVAYLYKYHSLQKKVAEEIQRKETKILAVCKF